MRDFKRPSVPLLRFLGATETVTGSRFLIDTPCARVLVDCGLFQGLKPLRLRNWDSFPVDPVTIDAILLTHAHLDHTGYVPALVRNGFKGRIFATQGTQDLCRIVLPDSGHLQEEDAAYANRSSRFMPRTRHNWSSVGRTPTPTLRSSGSGSDELVCRTDGKRSARRFILHSSRPR